jgi:hypothetical protein
MRIDHVIYAAEDVESIADRIQHELGVAAVGGGRHEGHGTQNRILPLGGGYLEVVGIANAEEAEGSPFGRGVLKGLSGGGEGWLAWVVAVDDIEGVAARLGTPVTTLRREGLSAQLTGVEDAMREPFLPFFVSRDPGVADPGDGGDAGGITWIEVAGDPVRLERWLDGAPLPVRVIDGAPSVRSVGIGDRAFR